MLQDRNPYGLTYPHQSTNSLMNQNSFSFMKFKKFIAIALLSCFFTACNAPIVNNTLAMPGRVVGGVVGPILGGLGL